MREDRLKAISEELNDISRILLFKEKRLSQSEAARNYKVCEQLTEDIMEHKSRRRELEAERRLFVQKVKRAKRRSDSTDTGSSNSRSVTPAADIELAINASSSSSPFPMSSTETDHSLHDLSDSDDIDLHF